MLKPLRLACIAFPLAGAPRFLISFPKGRSSTALDGRLLLVLSNDPSAEPRMLINDTPKTQMTFGIDVEALKPGQTATIDAAAFGYPVRTLSGSEIRRSRGALLERGFHTPELSVAAALQRDVRAKDAGADGKDSPPGADLKSWRY